MDKEKKEEIKEKAESKVKTTFTEFKEFALKGNIMDLAIGMVMGSAFTGIVNAVVNNLLSPLIGALTSNIDLSSLSFKIGDVEFAYGAVLNALISFIIIAFTMFLIVKGLAKANKKHEAKKEKTTKECPYCLSTIPIKATRCPNCTSHLDEEKVEE